MRPVARTWRVALALHLLAAVGGAIGVGASVVLGLQLAEQLGRRLPLAQAWELAVATLAGQLPLGGALVAVLVAAWVGSRWERAGWLRGLAVVGVGPVAGAPVAAAMLGLVGLALVGLGGSIGRPPAFDVARTADGVVVMLGDGAVLLRGDAAPVPVDAAALVADATSEPLALLATLILPLLAGLAGGLGFPLGVRRRWFAVVLVGAALSAASLWVGLAGRAGAPEGWPVAWVLGPPAVLAVLAGVIAVPRLS